jgi:hypothetical protein
MVSHLRKFRSPTVGLSHRLENRIHAAFLDFADLGHEFAESASGEGALFEPEEVFLGEIVDGDAVRGVFFFPEHSERHVGAVDFHQQVAEVLAVDLGNFKFQISSFK